MNGLSVHMLIRKVDLLTLRLFLAAIEERQISRAAIRENIATSAVTKRIKDLEDLAGTQLLERNPKGVAPSQAGQVLARHLRTLFSNLEDMRRELSEFTDGVRGYVRIAAPVSILVQSLARQIGGFSRDFPFIDVEIMEDINPVVVRVVKTGDADLGVFVKSAELLTDDLDTFAYRADRLVAVYPPGHAFSERRSVTLLDLLEERLIGVRAATTLMSNIQEAARGAGRELPLKYSVTSPEAALSLVKSGLGVTIQPECMLSIEDCDQVGTVSIAEDWAERHMFVATQKDKPLSAAAKLLVNHLTVQASADNGKAHKVRGPRN